MAKVRLSAGAEIDLLSPKDLEASMGDLEKFLLERDGTVDVQSAPPITLDGSGNGSGTVYLVPAGFHAFLTRLVLDYPASTAKTTVACDVRVCADAVTPAATRILEAALPLVPPYEASRSHAPMFRQGQQVVVQVTGGPTTKLYATVQVLLVPTRRFVHSDVLE